MKEGLTTYENVVKTIDESYADKGCFRGLCDKDETLAYEQTSALPNAKYPCADLLLINGRLSRNEFFMSNVKS